MRRIAVYGKGGIGKSTTASNISAAMAETGLKVIQIGCDPKSDSTRFLLNGRSSNTVLGAVRSGGTIDDYVKEGFNGVLCIECGGPRPGTGCAGRGIIAAFEELERQRFVSVYKPDVVIYDVLGDVVCGGFAMPIRNGYARDVFIVTSGENMSLYAAENIAEAVHGLQENGYARLSGLIQNSRGVVSEDQLVDDTAERIRSEVICRIPRDQTVQHCETAGKTVMEGAPDSPLAEKYRCLARRILNNSDDSEGGLRVE